MRETDKSTERQKTRVSRLAVWSCALGVTSLLGLIAIIAIAVVINLSIYFLGRTVFDEDVAILVYSLLLFVSLVSLILAIVALKKIGKSSVLLSGKGIAYSGMCASVPVLIMSGLTLSVAFTGLGPHEGRMTKELQCRLKLHRLAIVMKMYADDNDDRFPTADKWCDLLAPYLRHRMEGGLTCPSSEAKTSQSSYAMNKNIVGIKHSDIPPDVVLLFESKPGWNQVGGPEILTTENHKGRECNIMFNDFSVEFVETERLGELKWKVEEKVK